MNGQPRSINILIAALGGEGGGVLADWLIAAATHDRLPVQSTSIPGVAQRTGATTYYLEIFPQKSLAARQRRPILALTPTPADVDVVAATELVEAGRAMQNGYVTPQRTTLVASTNRVFAIGEKSAMADGRFDSERIVAAARELAQRTVLFDMAAVAQACGAPLNAVLFGALIGAAAVPISREAAETAIKQSGKSVDTNLRGFAAGFARAQDRAAADTLERSVRVGTARAPAALMDQAKKDFPEAVHDVLALGIARLTDYQNETYARLYLQRLRPLAQAEKSGGKTDYALTREAARLLALWMSYEDVIRVASLKTQGERLARIREDVRARDSDIVQVVDFLKPGLEELCSVLPPWLGAALRKRAEGHADRLNFGLHIRTTGVFGFLLLRVLAGLRWWRPHSLRYREEQHFIERWLAAVTAAIGVDRDLALEIAQCAQLVKGYGDTHKRGVRNFEAIEAAYFSATGTSAEIAARTAALRRARSAALADPEGIALKATLDKSE